MNQKAIYILATLGILIILGVTSTAMYYKQKDISPKPTDTSLKIEWRAASTLASSYEINKSYTWYTLRDNTISCMGTALPKADAATFVASSLDGYGKDKNHVYWCYEIIVQADPATFTVLSREYAKDSTHVFYPGGSIIKEANAPTFTPVLYVSPLAIDPLQTGYGKDKNYVFSQNRIVANADPATFVLEPVSHDKNWIYVNDTVVGPVSLIADNMQFSKTLPSACNMPNTDIIYPQVYPPSFSADGSIVGYPNDVAICIIDKKTNNVQIFPYGTQQGVSLSADGAKILFYKYQKGDGAGESTCKECGQYSYDRATGEIVRLITSR